MKFKFNWIISFCLVAFISLFNIVSAFAATVSLFPSDVANSLNFNYGSYKNVVYVLWNGDDTNGYQGAFYYSNNSLVLITSNTQIGYNTSLVSAKGFFASPNYGTYAYSTSLAQPVSSIKSMFVIQGSATFNGNSIAQGTSSQTGVLSPSDILDFKWDGSGLKIYNLTKGMNVSGYLDQSIKYFDIETYGKFIYQGDDTFFTSIAYKKMQTSIQLASVVTYGAETRHAGEGLGIKDFKWVSDTSHLKKGDEIRFRIVYQVPMLDKGVYNIKIGTTVNNGLSDNYISDSVESVNFLNENWDYGSPLDNSGETGNVGNEPGNTPKDSSNGGSIGSDPYSNMQYVLTLLSSFSGFIGSLFSFLPSEVKIMFVGVCTIIVALMVKRAVL
ncbi:hypothetical protein [Clostridium beijerinckii]|uniref:hypothetical protein n=1 Tax=Clostridium beijerinckii TaxID=1520 RepID=UPI0003D2CF6E|nr:hypothetical protein [Clostridium beijerinckii]ALB48315.1 hypothetical protein X276_25155 [Clostridium beijerinckii NRRL B-598]